MMVTLALVDQYYIKIEKNDDAHIDTYDTDANADTDPTCHSSSNE